MGCGGDCRPRGVAQCRGGPALVEAFALLPWISLVWTPDVQHAHCLLGQHRVDGGWFDAHAFCDQLDALLVAVSVGLVGATLCVKFQRYTNGLFGVAVGCIGAIVFLALPSSEYTPCSV